MTDKSLVEKAIQKAGSQMELARRIQSSPSVIGSWKFGRFKPDEKSRAKLEAYLENENNSKKSRG